MSLNQELFSLMSQEYGLTLLQSEMEDIKVAIGKDAWVKFSEYDMEPNEGWCWIVYKGRVVEAYRDHQGLMRFHPHSQNVYLSECISYAQYMEKPAMPDNNRKGDEKNANKKM